MNDEAMLKITERIVTEIRGLRPVIAVLVAKITKWLEDSPECAFTSTGDLASSKWCASFYREGLIKLEILLENNLLFVETVGVLALTRYIFELHAWLRVLDKDHEQCIELFWQTCEKQKDHMKAYKAKLNDEIAYFKKLHKRDTIPEDVLSVYLKDHADVSANDIAHSLRVSQDAIDMEARRRFCLYGEEAKINGYGFQAHLIETKVLPQVEEHLKQIQLEEDKIKSQLGEPRLFAVIKPNGNRKKWNWKERAESVSMKDQYDFIYSYTSRLLHATPVSFCTDQKNLELGEMRTFLEYIYVSLLDVINLAEKICSISNTEDAS